MATQPTLDAQKLAADFHRREAAAAGSARRLRIFHRRQLVAFYWETGLYTYGTLAAKLREEGIPATEAQVASDVNTLKRQWRGAAQRAIGDVIEVENAKLDSLEDLLIDSLREQRVTAEAYASTMLRIAERRAKLLGADQPTKIAVSVADNENFDTWTTEQLDAFMRGAVPEGLAKGYLTIDSSEVSQLTNGHVKEEVAR